MPSTASPLSLRLQDITETLASTNSSEFVFDVILHTAIEALGASAATVLLGRGQGRDLHLRATIGYVDGERSIWTDALMDDDGPAADALTRHLPLFFEHDRELARAYPNVEARTGATAPVAATAVLPMFLDERPLGVLVIDFQEPHPFTDEERRFLRILAAQCAIGFGRARLLRSLEGQVAAQTAEHAAQRLRADTLAALGDTLQAARSPDEVARLALPLLGEALTARTAMVVMVEEGLLRVPAVWGQVLPSMTALLAGGVPLEQDPLLAACARTGQAGYSADYNAAGGGLSGLPPLAFAAEPIRTPGGELSGFLTVWRDQGKNALQDGERDVLRRAAGMLALDHAMAEQALQERTAALDAFTAFTEAVGSESDVVALARQAITALRARFQDGSVAYYTRDGKLWKAQAWSEDITGALLERIQLGLPSSTPLIRQACEAGGVIFSDGWNAEQEQIEYSEAYGTAAAYPLSVNGEVNHLLLFGLKDTLRWSERDRALVRAVGRGLTLALERAEQTRRLEMQNLELEARTRALEAFAELSRNLTLHSAPEPLIERAMTIVLSLLPRGMALFYQKSGSRWHATVQVGTPGTPGVQDLIDAGFPVGQVPTVDRPDQTRQPHFQDMYNPAQDVTPEQVNLITRVQTVATLPVVVHEEVLGIVNVVLFEERPWNDADRAVLETTVRSLGLAIEGWQGVVHLAEERHKLAAANEELEAFSYSVSHDLRTPVRHIKGFNDLLRQNLGDRLDPKSARYVQIVDEAAGRMNTLIDAMLELSLTSRLPLRVTLVNLGNLVDQVLQDLRPEMLGREVRCEVGPLPLVMGDLDTLHQVMMNLLSNALKYSRNRELGVIEVWAEERPDEWAVFVRDNGAGFDPRYTDKLFAVFQRLHRHDEFEGVGVGLANVRRIIHRHGGQVQATGGLGAGATFGFTLPKR